MGYEQDFDKVEDILTKYKKFVKSNVAVDTKLPIYCTLYGLGEHALQVYVKVRAGSIPIVNFGTPVFPRVTSASNFFKQGTVSVACRINLCCHFCHLQIAS